ncbi:B3 domain-containing protein [Zea mays]|uniref:B3 domain-containing protein n=1 Tax=Zea mays TaxID=4577 RepID=A0A1D6KXP1_MAIZE|nr:B3 domain-containing protein [Zea mays]
MRKPSKGRKERDVIYHRNDHSDDRGKHFFKILIGEFHERLVSNFLACGILECGHYLLKSEETFVTNVRRMKMVLVFDPSGCEKVPPFFVTKNAMSGGRKREGPLDISSSDANLPMKTPETKKKAWKQRDRRGMTASEDDEAHSVPSYVLPRHTSLDTMQKRKVFSRKYPDVCLPSKSGALILQCHGKSWQVMYCIEVWKDRGESKRLRNGWAQFARDNYLQLGDICLFEPLKTKKCTMNVHIIRKKEYCTKMRKPSNGCKERDVIYHRNDHTDDNGKHFFKILIGDFHKRLVIPVKFAKKFRGKVERNIKLESLGGYTFDVQVAQNLGRIMFQSGWKSFVSAHDLKMFDLLVFKYDGMSRMKVLIFDPSGCEKVPPFFVTKNAMSGGRKREEPQEPLDISSSYADLPMKTPETKKKARKQRDRRGMRSSEDDEAHSVPSCILPRGTILDSMQRRKVKERLRAICSEIPIYVFVVKKSNIFGRSQDMVFSRKYPDVCLPFKSGAVILQCHGKSWEVILEVRKDQGESKRLRIGWAEFARDNNLQLGDICLFEPLKTMKYTMNVHIVRRRVRSGK